ncbi:25446_t:CDS:2 [Gigaspora margarita]|uniref:25446_t:CDS:1 n=1 Tax=Gigaspora margarita TaxID=4874 RepID=A0ABN7US07_GIGMA|nr:25446_t:CDS:2 [Gigaspora margarita]
MRPERNMTTAIELENEKARNKLINARDPLLSKLKSDPLIAPEFLAELQPFLGLIDGADFLTNPEKDHLKQAYDQAAGNIDNTLSEVEGALTGIELNEVKNRIKSTYNLTEEEFNTIIVPLTDKDLLEYVALLLEEVKKVQSGKITDIDSCYELLISYRDAAANSKKKKAYEAVNSYQQQVERIINDLQSKKQVINASLDELVKAENEEKLTLIYAKIKQNSGLYQDNNKKIIDNHHQRAHTAIKLESRPEATDTEKQLATQLRNIINGNSDKNVLENLQKELNEFKTAPAGEKKTIYNNYGNDIDLMLEEIKQELARREQSEKDQNKTPPPNNKKFSNENKKAIVLPVVIVVSEGRSSPDNTRNYSYSQETYDIISPELKKEARNLMFNGDTEDRNGTQPDKLVIRDMTSEELEEIRRRKEQMKNKKSFGKKKCDGCGKELDSKSAKEISIGQVGKKCAGCDNTINSDYIEGNGKGSWYCSTECANKHHKPKSEIEETQEKLQDLKSKLENSSNPNEKKQLEQEINDLKDHLKNQQKQNNPAKPSSPKESYGKIILTGAVIFSVVILVSTLIIRKKRKRVIKKRN